MTVTIKLIPTNLFREILSFPISRYPKDHPLYQNLEHFEAHSFRLKSRAFSGDPIDMAEEVFALFNDPRRDAERKALAGSNIRSLSVGDIVEVNGVNMICSPIGWTVLDNDSGDSYYD
jgi:hypothetical protein